MTIPVTWHLPPWSSLPSFLPQQLLSQSPSLGNHILGHHHHCFYHSSCYHNPRHLVIISLVISAVAFTTRVDITIPVTWSSLPVILPHRWPLQSSSFCFLLCCYHFRSGGHHNSHELVIISLVVITVTIVSAAAIQILLGYYCCHYHPEDDDHKRHYLVTLMV